MEELKPGKEGVLPSSSIFEGTPKELEKFGQEFLSEEPGENSDVNGNKIDGNIQNPEEKKEEPINQIQSNETGKGDGRQNLENAEALFDWDDSSSDGELSITIGKIQLNCHRKPPQYVNHQNYYGPSNSKTPLTTLTEDHHDLDPKQLHARPWLKPGADMNDYFNYGFNEESWNWYCQRHFLFNPTNINQTMEEIGGKMSNESILYRKNAAFKNGQGSRSQESAAKPEVSIKQEAHSQPTLHPVPQPHSYTRFKRQSYGVPPSRRFSISPIRRLTGRVYSPSPGSRSCSKTPERQRPRSKTPQRQRLRSRSPHSKRSRSPIPRRSRSRARKRRLSQRGSSSGYDRGRRESYKRRRSRSRSSRSDSEDSSPSPLRKKSKWVEKLKEKKKQRKMKKEQRNEE